MRCAKTSLKNRQTKALTKSSKPDGISHFRARASVQPSAASLVDRFAEAMAIVGKMLTPTTRQSARLRSPAPKRANRAVKQSPSRHIHIVPAPIDRVPEYFPDHAMHSEVTSTMETMTYG